MTSDEIKKYQDTHIRELHEIKANGAYVQGKNPTLLRGSPKKNPDNRVPIPWAKMSIEDMTGYAGSYQLDWDNISTDDDIEDEYIDIMRSIYEYNSADTLGIEEYKTALGYGHSYELMWTSDALSLRHGMLTPEFTIVRNSEMQIIYSDDLKPVMQAAIRWISEKECHVYTDRAKEVYTESNGNWSLREESPHPFGDVPCIDYRINQDGMPLYEAEKAIIDSHDRLISASQNEVDRFNALVALFPGKVDKNFVDKLTQLKVIDDLGQYDHWPEYLEKSLSNVTEYYNSLADRYERLFHKSIKVPDFSDENFGGNQSGIALAYKLLGLEFKAAQIDGYFTRGLKRRQKLIDNIVKISTASFNLDDYKLNVKNERNLPVDKMTAVQIATMLIGVLPKEDVIRILPKQLVPDVEKVLSRLESDQQGEVDLLGDL